MALTEKIGVRVRLAPSPTGPLHIGTARTALFNWLFAKQHGGVFIVRIEDTDKERSKKEFERNILENLDWLGLKWNEGPVVNNDSYLGKYGSYRQSERTGIYKKYLERLLDEGKAYYCYCTKEELEAERQVMLAQGLPPKYSGHCRNLDKPPANKTPQVIRFKTPEAEVEFKDTIRGSVKFNAALFGDITIAKDLNTALYNFAAAVDDEEMKITHVIRGEDHISNTPKQILLQQALGFKEIEYAHLPLILSRNRSKLSKRLAETTVFVSDYKDQGFLPEALINFLALLGWHPKNNKEIFTTDELIGEFNLRRVQKAGAVFDFQKLDWLQKEHLKRLENCEIVSRLLPILSEKNIKASRAFLEKVVAVEKSRLKTINEFMDTAGFFFKLPDYGAELLQWQKEPLSKTSNNLARIIEIIKGIKVKNFNREELSNSFADLITEEGRGAVLWPLRAAVSGQAASPDPLEIMEILGKKESLRRVKTALSKL